MKEGSVGRWLLQEGLKTEETWRGQNSAQSVKSFHPLQKQTHTPICMQVRKHPCCPKGSWTWLAWSKTSGKGLVFSGSRAPNIEEIVLIYWPIAQLFISKPTTGLLSWHWSLSNQLIHRTSKLPPPPPPTHTGLGELKDNKKVRILNFLLFFFFLKILLRGPSSWTYPAFLCKCLTAIFKALNTKTKPAISLYMVVTKASSL